MPATPASRRKSGHALPELPPGLLNVTLLVPRDVFPKEQVPAGFEGWRAQVVGADTQQHDDGVHCNVKFPAYPELYHFPISAVQCWLVEAGEERSGSRPPAGRRSAAARARARLQASALEEEEDEDEDVGEEAHRQCQQQQQHRSAARAAASKKAATPRKGRTAVTSAAATPYSLRNRQREAAAEEEQAQQQQQQQRWGLTPQRGRQREQEAADGESETDGEELEDLTLGGKVAAALQEGLFTALAVLIVYALLSRFYQPLDAIA